MTTYHLYIESGPKQKKTMVHLPELLGCMANGPTTEAAIAATPGAIVAFKRFLRRHGEAVDPEAPDELRVAEHITEGMMLGDGSPYISFAPDFEPIDAEEIELALRRLEWIAEELAAWVETQSSEQLDARVAGSRRSARDILLHLIAAKGPVLSISLGSAPGFGKIRGAAERGQLAMPLAVLQAADLARERVGATTDDDHRAVRIVSGNSYTLRKSLRHMIEHDWEHLAELSRRPGGPVL